MRYLKSASLVISGLIFSNFYSTTFAQETNQNQLKLYSNFGWSSETRTVGFDTTTNTPIVTTSKSNDLGYFTPAFAFATAKGNYHEIEFSKLQINKTSEVTLIDPNNQFPTVIEGERKTNFLIAFRYEYNLVLFKQKEGKKITPSLGFAARPFYSNSSFQPVLANQFSSGETAAGILLSIVPRLNYNIGEKWFLDLDIPLNLAQLSIKNSRLDNPALPVNQRSVTTLDANLFPSQYLIRFGLGLKL